MTGRVKVAHLITRLDLGGAQGNTLHTVSHLDPARFDSVLVCGEGGYLDGKARALAADPKRPFTIRLVESLVREVRPLTDLRALFQLSSILREERPDVVHTHSSKAGVLGRVAARMAGVPVVVHTYHGFGFHDGQPALLKRLCAALESACRRLSTWTVFVSDDNRRCAERLGVIGRGRWSLIRSGVPLAALPARVDDRGAKKAALGCGMHKPLVVGVGNLKPQKDPLAFIGVAERCLRAVPEARFLFVGDGELKTFVQSRLVARGLHGKVLFPGWREDVAEILAAADAFVLTSRWEGLPRALLEAMKTGLPCACWATDGVRDVLRDGDNGLLAPTGDEPGLAERVVRLLREPELARRLGAAAAASIGPEFDIDRMVRDQEALYERLLAEKSLG